MAERGGMLSRYSHKPKPGLGFTQTNEQTRICTAGLHMTKIRQTVTQSVRKCW